MPYCGPHSSTCCRQMRSAEDCWHIIHTYSLPCPLPPPSQVSREPGSTPAIQLVHTLQDIYSTIEMLYEGGANNIGPAHCFFELLESGRDSLPVS